MDERELRRLILEQAMGAGVGHIGSALSVADILAVIYGGVLQGAGTGDPNRDVFVLSKGHAAMALYAALHLAGVLDREVLATYCRDGSLLGVHPEHQLPGIDFSTGSLGHGLSLGVGSALGARMAGRRSRVFVLMSDAELDEGSVWEAAMFASQHHLGNLCAVVDANGQQALGSTADVIDLEPLAPKWAEFGWQVAEVDGHNKEALEKALTATSNSPQLVVARTSSGRGVSFMERRVEWHYLPMTPQQYRDALVDLAG